MSARLHRSILLALLLILPLHGMASVMHALTCAPHEGHPAAAASAHEHAGHHDHGAPQHEPDESDKSATEHASHQCCNHFSAALVSLTSKAPLPAAVFQASVALFELSFELEQPQRPPRS
ncbi:MAG TPA: hypothetical protein VD867_03425 [Burkholderiales bacterium]|nr:hypothetical protein [Burkholderiales bacterium]